MSAAPAASARILLRDAEGVPLLWQQRIGQGQLLPSLPGDWNAASNAALRDPQLPRPAAGAAAAYGSAAGRCT
jgi:hypothetical protein